MGYTVATRVPKPDALARAFAAGRMPAQHPHGHYVIESSTTPEQDYRMVVNSTSISCSCPATRECLHVAALRYCLAHRIMGVYAVCSNCKCTRVAKFGGWCIGCASQRQACIEQDGQVAA